MDSKTVKELKALAKERDIKGYYKLRKAELIEALATQGSPLTPPPSNILDEPIPEINVPIPETITPAKPSMFNWFTEKVHSSISRFTSWVTSFIPESMKTKVNIRAENLNDKINVLITDKLIPHEKATALKRYLKTRTSRI